MSARRWWGTAALALAVAAGTAAVYNGPVREWQGEIQVLAAQRRALQVQLAQDLAARSLRRSLLQQVRALAAEDPGEAVPVTLGAPGLLMFFERAQQRSGVHLTGIVFSLQGVRLPQGVYRYPVTLTLTGSLPHVVRFLALLEGGARRITVSSVTATAGGATVDVGVYAQRPVPVPAAPAP